MNSTNLFDSVILVIIRYGLDALNRCVSTPLSTQLLYLMISLLMLSEEDFIGKYHQKVLHYLREQS